MVSWIHETGCSALECIMCMCHLVMMLMAMTSLTCSASFPGRLKIFLSSCWSSPWSVLKISHWGHQAFAEQGNTFTSLTIILILLARIIEKAYFWGYMNNSYAPVIFRLCSLKVEFLFSSFFDINRLSSVSALRAQWVKLCIMYPLILCHWLVHMRQRKTDRQIRYQWPERLKSIYSSIIESARYNC